MSRTKQFTEVLCFSGIMGLICEYFGNIRLSAIILLGLLFLDTTTGATAAIKFKRFNSRGLQKFIKKVLTYGLCILTVRLLEVGVLSLVKTTLLSQITVAYLIITEAISILENLTTLGVPLPSNFIPYLLNYLKIPGFKNGFNLYRDIEKDISEIEDMIKYQIPMFHDEQIRILLKIKFEVWKGVTIHINNLLKERDAQNPELTFYKVMSQIEMGFKEMEGEWKAQDISPEYIVQFNAGHQPKVDQWLQKVKDICFSTVPIQKKKEQIIDSMVTILYQTIMDALKVYN